MIQAVNMYMSDPRVPASSVLEVFYNNIINGAMRLQSPDTQKLCQTRDLSHGRITLLS